MGRFFSGFGYLNEVHAHAWDFVDQPLAYQAMFGGQSRQDGVQVKWLAPTDLFLEFGAEAGNGDALPGDAPRSATASTARRCSRTSAATSATTRSWRAGLSWLDSNAEDRAGGIADASGDPLFECLHRRFADLGASMACSSGRRRPRRQLKVQGEYLHRDESGEIAFDAAGVAAGRRLSQHAVRLVPAERLPVRAALARGRALRLAGFGHAALQRWSAAVDGFRVERAAPIACP